MNLPSTPAPSILVAHPWMGRGGSEAAAMWTLDALQGVAEVTFATASPVDWEDLNRVYRTRVSPDRVRLAPRPRIRVGSGARLVHWQRACFERYCRSLAPAFDLCLSAYNPLDFGRPGIQLVGDFSFSERARLLLYPNAGERAVHRPSLARRAYLAAGDALGGRGRKPLESRGDWVVANSRWTAAKLDEVCGLAPAGVIYPPCPMPDPAALPGSGRDPLGFVCLGRISPEKEIESVIAILEMVRLAGHPATLDVAGGLGEDAYSRKIRRLAEERRDWIRLAGFLGPEGKTRLFSSRTYGIHGCRVEAFGIAVAEMAGAGLIPLVPAEGGATEIVSRPELIYRSVEEAAEKIIALIASDEACRAALRGNLAQQAGQYRPEAFARGLRRLVGEVLGRPLAAELTPEPPVPSPRRHVEKAAAQAG